MVDNPVKSKNIIVSLKNKMISSLIEFLLAYFARRIISSHLFFKALLFFQLKIVDINKGLYNELINIRNSVL
jgi:hypothetical protein